MSGKQNRTDCVSPRNSRPRTGSVVAVLLVEEHVLMRQGVKLLIETGPDMVVCGEVSTVAEAIHGPWEPDVVLHGLLLPDKMGPAVVIALRTRFPRARLVALTRLDTPVYVHLAVSAGDSGFVLKSATPGELIEAVRKVARGERWVQPSLGALLARWDEIPRRHERSSAWGLTRREQEVLELLALGHTNAEVAEDLGVALRTVEAHRAHLIQKLGLRTRAEIVRFVNQQHLGTISF
ncbi:MAG: LuxR C-terminal-related transcriptional regulator [Acidimicrobiales bacterium]